MNTLNQAFTPPPQPAAKIGSILVNRGKITKDDFKDIIAFQQEQDLRFGDAARQMGLVKTEDITAVLEEQFGCAASAEQTDALHPQLRQLLLPGNPQAEALRSLRSELLLRYFGLSGRRTHQPLFDQVNFNQDDAPSEGRQLAIVGTDNAAALAMTCAQLGLLFAQLGLRTLLVDSNLRNPQLHRLLGTHERNPGLADLIAGRRTVIPQQCLRFLSVVTAGTPVPNPQELLAQRGCREQLHHLSSNYDVTLINTAPMTDILDAQLVATGAGAALVVVNQNQSRLDAVTRLCQSLHGSGVQLLGAALHE